MRGQENRGDYSSDDNDNICASNIDALGTLKTKRQHHRNLKSQNPSNGFTSSFISKMSIKDKGTGYHATCVKTFLRKMIMELPCTSAINSCLISIFRCVFHGQCHQRSCTSSGYSSSEEWEPPHTRRRTNSLSQRLKRALPRLICQIFSLIFTVFTVAMCSRSMSGSRMTPAAGF